MYNVELIPKQSVMDEILEFWKSTGRDADLSKGQFVFENVEHVNIDHGTIVINKGDNQYAYNMSDFYRAKTFFIGVE